MWISCLAVVLAAVALAGPAAAQPPLRVAIIQYKTEESVRESYTPLVDYLAAELGTQARLEILTSDDLAFRLAEGEVDIGVFTPFPYLEAKLNFAELEVFASHVVHGEGTYRGVILVRADSGIETLGDLAGRRFQFVKPTSTSGFKYPVGIFREHGFAIEVPPVPEIDDVIEGDFLTYGFSGGHWSSLDDLLQGEVDGIAIDRTAFDELVADDRNRLRTLEEYELPYHAYVFRPGMAEAERQRIQRVMFKAHRDPDARAAFDNRLGIERWVSRDDTDYNSLRRYLGMVRSRPTIAIRVEARENARRALEELGDALAMIRQGIQRELLKTRRFEPAGDQRSQISHSLEVDIGRVGETYHCQLSFDGEPQETFALAASELALGLPRRVVDRTLGFYPLRARLLHAKSGWFITYGTDDGLSADGYRFSLATAAGEELPLADDAILELTGVNTFFAPRDDFARGAEIVARHRPEAVAEDRSAESSDPRREPGAADRWQAFWDDADNRWGVIGLLVALASVVAGSYLTRRKKRRFKSILNETLQLLTLFVGNKYDITMKIAEQREKINRYLDRGYISENQYLILKDHISEVERVVEQLGGDAAGPSEALLESAVRKAVADGVVTEKELSSLAERIEEPDP